MDSTIIKWPRRFQSIRPHTVLVLCVFSLILLAVTPNTAWSQEYPQTRSGQTNQFEIKSDVNLVVLHLTVRDHEGNLVGELDKENFQIYEDKVLQQVESFGHEDIPVTIGLVVDNSGSMKSKRPEVITAVLAFAHSSNPQDEMFVVNFNDTVTLGLPQSTPFTDQPSQLKLALSGINAGGRTALYDAISYALEHLKQGSHDKKALVVVSDGGDNASKHTLSEIMALVAKSDAMIYTVGLFDPEDPDRNPHALMELAKAAGGEAFLPESPKDVVSICERVALEIRSQYAVAYISSNKKQDGTYRSITVKANVPSHERLVVRARSGYYAPSRTQSSPETKGKRP
jgi:Ca-activated chloride channel family protein